MSLVVDAQYMHAHANFKRQRNRVLNCRLGRRWARLPCVAFRTNGLLQPDIFYRKTDWRSATFAAFWSSYVRWKTTPSIRSTARIRAQRSQPQRRIECIPLDGDAYLEDRLARDHVEGLAVGAAEGEVGDHVFGDGNAPRSLPAGVIT